MHHKALGFFTSVNQAHSCGPSTQKVEAGGSGIHGHPLLHREYRVGLVT